MWPLLFLAGWAFLSTVATMVAVADQNAKQIRQAP